MRSPRPEPLPVSVPPPAPPAETMAGLRTDALAGLLTATVIQRSAADTAVGGPTVQRKKTVDMATVNAKSALKASIGGKTASDVKKRLEKRFPKGPLFDASDLLAIQTLEASAEGKKYLAEVGIGLYTEAVNYLNAADYKGWLKQLPGKRLLIATIAWQNKTGANDPNPPPSFTLGRAMAIQSGGLNAQAKQQAEKERDAQIRDAFVNTLTPVAATEIANVRATAGNDADDMIAANAQAQHILARILLILQVGLQVYDPTRRRTSTSRPATSCARWPTAAASTSASRP